MNIVRLIITDGRQQMCDEMLSSFDWYCDETLRTVIINDSGNDNYAAWLKDRVPNATIFHHTGRHGLAQSIRSGWHLTSVWQPDYILHLEDDIIFTRDIDLPAMIRPLTLNPHLAQVCLQRGPQSPDEIAAGGILHMYADRYGITLRDGWTEQSHLFSLQPNIYPAWVTQVGWPEHGGEREYTDKLLARDAHTTFGYLDGPDADPRYIHAGYGIRTEGWRV